MNYPTPLIIDIYNDDELLGSHLLLLSTRVLWACRVSDTYALIDKYKL